MNKGIYDIRGEIRITAENEQAARQLIEHQGIAANMCSWSKNPLGNGGNLYISGEIFFDSDGKKLTFQKTRSK